MPSEVTVQLLIISLIIHISQHIHTPTRMSTAA